MNSVLTPDILRTHAGIFSLVLSRNVTFSTVLGITRAYFLSVEDFFNAINMLMMSAPELPWNLAICTTKAYSKTPVPARTHEAAPKIWAATEEWEDNFDDEVETMSWADGFKYLQRADIPQLGSAHSQTLTGYLFLADLASSGVVVPPTVEEVGKQVFRLNRGALHTLLELGVCLPGIDVEALTKEQVESLCIKAFVKLYRGVEAGLGDSDAAKMDYSPIMLEHALCKYKRFAKAGLCQFTEEELKPVVDAIIRAGQGADSDEDDEDGLEDDEEDV